MGTSRNVISDLEAIAAMPGLEEIAAAINPSGNGSDTVSMLIFNAAQWAAGSRNKLNSLLMTTDVWQNMRNSARRAGRTLPARAPSQDQFHKFRIAGGRDLAHLMSEAFILASRDLVLSTGLLPDNEAVLHMPARENVIYADGTVLQPYSDAQVIGGKKVGSRAKTTATVRKSKRYVGKSGDKNNSPANLGMPAAMVGLHGKYKLQRCVLGVGVYWDRDETGCSMSVINRVHHVYDSRIHALIYDALLPANQQRKLMQMGIIPIVDMPNAAPKARGINVSTEMGLQLGTKARPIHRARLHYAETARHIVNGHVCKHALWGLNGAVVTTAIDEWEPNLDSPRVEQVALAYRNNPHTGDKDLLGTYRVPCRHGSFAHTIELSRQRAGSRGPNSAALADWIRPIDVTAAMTELRGLRSDVESLFATIKETLSKHRRARSMTIDHVHQDLIGAGMWVNATAWDVHAAQHTTNGRVIHEAIHRREHDQHGGTI